MILILPGHIIHGPVRKHPRDSSDARDRKERTEALAILLCNRLVF
jgi:hypothetical protein